jgi:hypothetical protein
MVKALADKPRSHTHVTAGSTAIQSALVRRHALIRCTRQRDANGAERALRGAGVGRGNSTFVKSDAGGRHAIKR